MSDMELVIDASKLQQALIEQPEKLTKNLDRAIERSLQTFARAARNKAPKAFSTLTNSIRVTRDGPLEGTVAPGVDYGQAVEQGTGAYGPNKSPSGNVPPVENILDWVNLQNMTPNDPTMSRLDLAWLIARKIAEKGTPAQPYLLPAYEENQHVAERLINVAINASVSG